MKKEWVLAVLVTSICVVVALGLIRWIAPGLLGYSIDQQLIRVSKELPSFYENIFRPEDIESEDFMLSDPYVFARAKPLYPDLQSIGPNDILGFRNRFVPNSAEIVAIGDSQTYGNNAALEFNWPSHLQKALFKTQNGQIYNISVGSWGAINYSRILDVAFQIHPRTIVVAFYTGNDPITDFQKVYSIDDLAHLRPDKALSTKDVPEVEYPPPKHNIIPVTFSDGIQTAFAPLIRYHSNNRDTQAVIAGYQIISQVAKEMAFKSSAQGVNIVFTIIPTKELVYAEKVAREGITVGSGYEELVRDEKVNISKLASELSSIPNARYADVVTPLQHAALLSRPLYPEDANGHPISQGYYVIAAAIANSIEKESILASRELVVLKYSSNCCFALITEDGYWRIIDSEVAEKNGWTLKNASFHAPHLISSIPFLGILDEVNPDAYGPTAN
jgi:lysophospholipase L1-like esterase